MENGRKFVLRAPDGRYFVALRTDAIECGAHDIALTPAREIAASYRESEPLHEWLLTMIDAGMLVKEYLPELRYGVMVRFWEPSGTITKYLCEQPRFSTVGYVLVQNPSTEFPLVTWPTVADIPFKVSAAGFQGHDRLIAVEVIDGKPLD